MDTSCLNELESAILADLEDWELLMRFLPAGWEAKARELKAIQRLKGFPDAQALLRALFIHLTLGCSLKETALRCSQNDVAHVSHVAIWKRLRASGPWLQWMAHGVMAQYAGHTPSEFFGSAFQVRLVDGSAISEPGSTGSDWRIHYAVNLANLHCDFVEVTEVSKSGESFTRFPVSPGDLLLGDRVYAARPGIRHVVSNGGHVLVRLPLTNLPLQTAAGTTFSLLEKLRKIGTCEIGEWSAQTVPASKEETPIPLRVCAIKRSETAAAQARQRIERTARHKGHKPRPETLEAAGYVFVATTAPADKLSPAQTLELYRGRWQVELAFKRLKSLMELGHLHKKDPESARAWLHGKLLAAFLTSALIHAGESFFPWGYPGGERAAPR